MLQKTGSALVIVLVIAAGVVLFTGALESIWPAPQSSPVAQQFVNPGKPVDAFPFTTLGKLKNQKQRLNVIEATTSIIQKEYDKKIGASQNAYDKLIGTIDNPGLLGSGMAALLAAYGMAMYKNKTLYSEVEVKEKVDTAKEEAVKNNV